MQLGKPTSRVMAETVFRFNGHKSRKILVGPHPGVDVSVVEIGQGQVMIASCDPISFIPHLGPRDSAVMSVNEVASDVATSGARPTYAMFDLNLPPHFSDVLLRRFWRSIHETCKGLGLSIIGGSTGRFEGCDYSIIGGATMWTTCRKNEFLTSSMAGDGDDLIFTKSAAYGATSVLARAFPKTVRKHLGQSLFEMAEASDLGGVIDLEIVPVSEETLEICKLFKLDPLTSLGEGSLLIASRPHRTRRVIDILQSGGTRATVIGQLSSRTEGLFGVSTKGRVRIRHPKRDPYWNAYWQALRKGWS